MQPSFVTNHYFYKRKNNGFVLSFQKKLYLCIRNIKNRDMNTLFIHILLNGLIILLEKPMGSGSCA